MGIDLLDLAFRLERQLGVRVSPDQFSNLAIRNDPPDIRVGDLFDLLCGGVPESGVLDLELDADTLWPIYQRAISDALGVDPDEVTKDKGLIHARDCKKSVIRCRNASSMSCVERKATQYRLETPSIATPSLSANLKR
jgi:hypothetical protein